MFIYNGKKILLIIKKLLIVIFEYFCRVCYMLDKINRKYVKLCWIINKIFIFYIIVFLEVFKWKKNMKNLI